MKAAVVPFVDEGLGNSSYLVDLGDGRALIIDPERDPSPYLAEAARRALRIAFVADTHLHADFVSGARELAAVGAEVFASAGAHLAYPHRPVRDEEEAGLGGLVLRALATPGHTPEHVSYVLLDDATPVAVFTGGALIVGSVARTDLIGPDQTEPLAHASYRSVRERLGVLPDALAVYPTHGAGSFCSVPGGGERVTTIGRERAGNIAFAARDEDTFVATLLAGYGSFPPYFLRLRTVNRRGPVVYGTTRPSLNALTVDDVRSLAGDGAVIVDARPVAAFAAGHVPRSVSIELRPAFATWLGWLVEAERPIVFILDQEQDRDDAVRQCLKIGHDLPAGLLSGGVDAWRDAGLDVARIDVVEPREAEGPFVDVRQRSELESGAIPGAIHAELGGITSAVLPEGRLTLHCGHGQRAMTAASLLERRGRRGLAVMNGGPDEWSRAHGVALAAIA